MCIISLKPEGIEVPLEKLQNMWNNNDDGAGFMYATRGKLHVVKGLMTFNKFYEAYRRVDPRHKIVMHFRIRTHGGKTPELTHPFWIHKKKVAMVHNGIISATSKMLTDTQESDTSLYAKILSQRHSNILDALTSEKDLNEIAQEIGWSKLVFLTNEGDHHIVNEKAGYWRDGCWYSNLSFERTWYSYGGRSSWSFPQDDVWESDSGTIVYQEIDTSRELSTTKKITKAQLEENDKEWAELVERYSRRYGY